MGTVEHTEIVGHSETVAHTQVVSATEVGHGPVNEFATSFDGVDDYAHTSNTVVQLGTAGIQTTFSVWLLIRGTPPNTAGEGTDHCFGIGHAGLGVGARQIAFYCRPRPGVATDLAFEISPDGDTRNLHRITMPTVNVWHHHLIAVDMAAATPVIHWYVDGALDSSINIVGGLTSFQSSIRPFMVAADGDPSVSVISNRNVDVDEFGIYDNLLGLTEAADHYNGGNAKQLQTALGNADLQHYWRMGDGATSPTVPDLVGGQDLTLVNGPVFTTSVPGS